MTKKSRNDGERGTDRKKKRLMTKKEIQRQLDKVRHCCLWL